MPRTIPCLWFDGRAEEAAQLYTSLFPNSKIASVSHYGPDMPMPEGTVLTVNFTLDGQEYLALNGGPEYQFTPAVSFQIMCADQDEVDHYWDGLTSGGGSPGPCGWLTDRFGLSWQVVPTVMQQLLDDPDPARAGRATQAMMRMGKLDIAALQRAADGEE
jgi:predicted 3-demethylubiquinone-9 3-methyltransferase (glyoxalase superfamily)